MKLHHSEKQGKLGKSTVHSCIRFNSFFNPLGKFKAKFHLKFHKWNFLNVNVFKKNPIQIWKIIITLNQTKGHWDADKTIAQALIANIKP